MWHNILQDDTDLFIQERLSWPITPTPLPSSFFLCFCLLSSLPLFLFPCFLVKIRTRNYSLLLKRRRRLLGLPEVCNDFSLEQRKTLKLSQQQ